MATDLHMDFETRSVADLKKVGLYRYAEDPSTTVILARFRFDDGPLIPWLMGTPFPQAVIDHIAAGRRVVAHNAGFERQMWNVVLRRQLQLFVWPTLAIQQMDCTMARGLAMGLPGSLDMLGKALGVATQKDKEGYRLMLSMCKPQKIREDGTPVWKEDAHSLERLGVYCDFDVLTECDIDKKVPHLTPEERRVWELDQLINDRGVMLDTRAVRMADAVAQELQERAHQRMAALTEGAVKKCTEAKKIIAWLNSRGIPCDSVAKTETDDLICGAELMSDPTAIAVVQLRDASSKAFKYATMLDMVSIDGRVRGSLAYHGAHTGRWAGRGIQPQNFKRVETDEDAVLVKQAMALLTSGNDAVVIADAMCFMFDNPLDILSRCSRSMLIAAPGKKFVGGDFSNVEGRVNAWLAGQDDKLQAFRDYDAGIGPDLYKITAGNINGIPPEQVTKAMRQEQGKVPELACGYQGAKKAFAKMGAKYGVVLSDERVASIVSGWRITNHRIAASWLERQDAAIDACSSAGVVISLLEDRVRYTVANGFLFSQLPSGRVISYASPTVEFKTKEVDIDGEVVEISRWGVSYWGVNKTWRKLDLYGGSQCNHDVQGTARDLMVSAMHRAEDAGYTLVLTVHDELLAEVDADFGSEDEFKEMLSILPVWAKGLPLAATAWEDVRYVK